MHMPVPLLDVNAQNSPLAFELKEAFERVLQSGQFILGPDVVALEMEVAGMVGAKHAIGVSSGTDALLLALMALGIGPGDEVLCPTYTFFATAGCVARTGATPVFVDADLLTFNLCTVDLARKISSRAKAIIPVHLFGQCAKMDEVMRLARKHNLAVIEDAAQSLGAHYKGQAAGTIGDFGTFSFFPSKNLGALGDAGMLVSNNDALAESARLLRNHGANPKYYHKAVGGNFRLDSLQAAFLRVKLPHLQRYTARRRANAAYYTQEFRKLSGVAHDGENSDNARLVLPRTNADQDHIWNQYTLRVVGSGHRTMLRAHLSTCEIGNEVYYPVPMHKQQCFSYCVSPSEDTCPVATRLGNEALSIPIYPELAREQLDAVVSAVGTVFNRL